MANLKYRQLDESERPRSQTAMNYRRGEGDTVTGPREPGKFLGHDCDAVHLGKSHDEWVQSVGGKDKARAIQDREMAARSESTNSKFDTALENVYKSLMIEAGTDTGAESLEKRAGAVATAHKNKSLKRKTRDSLSGNPDGEIADKYDELQKLKKNTLLPDLTDAIKALKNPPADDEVA